MSFRWTLLAAAVCSLAAQDPGLVLSTSVSFGTMAASTNLTPETRAEVDRLRQEAMLASRAGKHGDALKHLYHGMALMRGQPWTPAASRAASLTLKADHAIWEPGSSVRIRFEPLYKSDAPATPLITTITLRPAVSGSPAVIKQLKLNGSNLATTIAVPRVTAGKYRLEASVPPLIQPKVLHVAVAPGARKRAGKLRSRVARLRTAPGSALWTAQYAVELFDRADRSNINPGNFDLDRELSWGEQVASSLEAGRDPFAGRVGDMRRAYLSAADNTLQPYRLYVPSGYKPDRSHGLVVALHGMGGDENSLFDRYRGSGLFELAEKYSCFVVTPKGREPASMYQGAAEQDVLDVLAEVRSNYRIDASRLFLMGHSMGAYGTWSIAMNHPELFAALGPVAGGGNPTGMERIRHIPQFVVHGDNDKTVPVRNSRVMVEAGRALGADVEYLEVKGGGHVDVFVPALPRLFEWFNAHSKP